MAGFKHIFPLYPSHVGGSSSGDLPTLFRSTSTLPGNYKRSSPHRKYTKRWRGHAWDRAGDVGRWPRIIYLSVGTIIIGAWIGVMFVVFLPPPLQKPDHFVLTGCGSLMKRSCFKGAMPVRPTFAGLLSMISKVLFAPREHYANLIPQSAA
jgi:hypothetical protein